MSTGPWHKAQTHTCRAGNVREDSSKARRFALHKPITKGAGPSLGFSLTLRRGHKKGSGLQCMEDGVKRTVENLLYLSVASGCKNLISHILLCLPGASRKKTTAAFTSKCWVMWRKLCCYSALIKLLAEKHEPLIKVCPDFTAFSDECWGVCQQLIASEESIRQQQLTDLSGWFRCGTSF